MPEQKLLSPVVIWRPFKHQRYSSVEISREKLYLLDKLDVALKKQREANTEVKNIADNLKFLESQTELYFLYK